MPNELPIPPELLHLLEKREAELDRRQHDRRRVAPLAAESALESLPASGDRRRQTRRQQARRHDDPQSA